VLAAAAMVGARERLSRNPFGVTVAGVAAHVRGLVDRDGSALDDAIRIFEKGARPLALAAAREDAGALAAEDGDPGGAIVLLGQALETFAAHGATSDAARVRAALRGLGVRRRLATAARPSHGWAGLTDSEAQVARLVALGLTNREVAERLFVSAHTVSSHLRNAFAKLGINSRVELARLAARQPEDLP
jgi:DNA-binding CsgD family transcriptional regulator